MGEVFQIGSLFACAEWVHASGCWFEAVVACGGRRMLALVLAVGLVNNKGSFFFFFVNCCDNV